MMLDDPSLRGLGMLSEGCSAIVQASVTIDDARVLKHHAGRRMTLLLQTTRGPFVAKLYTNHRGRNIAATMISIASLNLPFRIPPVVGYDENAKMLLLGWLPGISFAELDEAPLTSGMSGVGVGVAAMHRSPLQLPKRRLPCEELDQLRELLRPGWSGGLINEVRATQTAEGLAELRQETHLAVIHRDLYDAQIIDGTPPGIIDFDEACMGDPAFDVGNLLAHLRVLAWRRTGSANALAGPASAFIGGYRRAGAPTNDHRIHLWERATLLRLAVLAVRRANNPAEARAMVSAAAA